MESKEIIGYGILLSCGEYDDYRSWISKIYLNKEEAQKYIEKYNKLLMKLSIYYDDKVNDINTIDPYNIIWDKYYTYKNTHNAEIQEIKIIQ